MESSTESDESYTESDENSPFSRTDSVAVWLQLMHQDKEIQLKRRWLLGLPISNIKRKKYRKPKFLQTRLLSESLHRNDDIFYENVKSRVEEAFGACRPEGRPQALEDDIKLLDISSISRALLSSLPHLTTKGLYLLAMALTGGSAEFEKTRWKMTKVVKESLSGILRSRNYNHQMMETSKQLYQILNDPRNFRDISVPSLTSRLHIKRAAARNILDGLVTMPIQTLVAMNKKLKGVKSIPQLQPRRTGWIRDSLVNQVRKNSEKFLSEFDIEDEFPEPLAKALEVAGLSLKITYGFHNSSITEFHEVSSEIKTLQNDIAKAIWLVKTKIRVPELKRLQSLLVPNAKVQNKHPRLAVKRMLTQYLFECSDLDTIPKSLLDTLAIINKNSRSIPDEFILQNAMDKDVECILNVSAHTKQIIWDLLPANDLDVDFTDAYMEDLEESDEDDLFTGDDKDDDDDDDMRLDEDSICQNSDSSSYGSNQEVESTGGSMPFDSKLPTRTTAVDKPFTLKPHNRSDNVSVNGLEAKVSTGMESADSSFEEPKGMNDKETTDRNNYLMIQEACDETSLIAYDLIGHMLEKLGQKEGLDLDSYASLYLKGDCANEEDSQGTVKEKRASTANTDGWIVVGVTEELIPSFPKRGMEKLRKLMGL
ncbi:hypothetical protein UlMin_017923 [Ulmus minor]